MKKIRYTVDFPEQVMDILTSLSVITGTTKADVLRQAIALYSFVSKEVAKGNCLSITKNDVVIKDIILLNK